MHICLITHEYPKAGFAHGGIGSFLKTFAPKLVANGIKVTVLGLSYDYKEDYEEDQGVQIYRLGCKNIKWFSWYFGLKVLFVDPFHLRKYFLILFRDAIS